MSGRREAQVAADAACSARHHTSTRLAAASMIDGERTLPDRRLAARRERCTPAERMVAAGIPISCSSTSTSGSSGTRPWHTRAASSRCLTRGKVDVDEANELIAEHGHVGRSLPQQRCDRPRDGGHRGPAHAYHLVPGGASKAKARRLPPSAPRLRARELHRDRRFDREPRSGRRRWPLFRGRQRARARRGLREALARFPNAAVTEGSMGDGFYEAATRRSRCAEARRRLVSRGRREEAGASASSPVRDRAAASSQEPATGGG